MRDTTLYHKIWVELSQKALRNERYSHLFLGLVPRTSNLDVGRRTLSCLVELRSNVEYLENVWVILSVYDTFNDTGSSSDQGCANPGRLRFLYGGDRYFWAPSMELPSCQPSGAQNIKVATAFFWNFCTLLAQTIKLQHPTLR
jgi:hypothetical protein